MTRPKKTSRDAKPSVRGLSKDVSADVFSAIQPKDVLPTARTIHCVICGSDTQEHSPENMCWVCRRLKISAWRDVEQQVPIQE